MGRIDDCLRGRSAIYNEVFSDHIFLENMNGLFQKIYMVLSRGGKLLLCGNGGSAADCQHIASEFVGKLTRDKAAWPAIALCADVSVITCLGNDYSYENILEGRLKHLKTMGIYCLRLVRVEILRISVLQ